jgi:hypothetical protein
MEMPRRREAVTRVVPDPAHDHGSLTAEARDLPARRLHQPLDRDAESLLRERVDFLDLAAS